MTGFWRTWLTVWCWGVAGLGIVLMGAAFALTDGPSRALMELMNPGAPPRFDPALRFSAGLMGAVTFGWGLTMLAIVRTSDMRIWRPVTGALLVWYVVDSAISIATGFALNAASNTLLIGLFLLAMVRSGALSTSRAA